MSSSLYQEEKEDFTFLETIIHKEGTDLNPRNNLTIVYRAFPGNLP